MAYCHKNQRPGKASDSGFYDQGLVVHHLNSLTVGQLRLGRLNGSTTAHYAHFYA